MKKNMFKTSRHQLDRITDYRDDIYQPEDFHDDAFQMIDISSVHHKEKDGNKERNEKVHKARKAHAGHKAAARPVSCSPDEKAEEFNKQARHGAGRKETAKK